MPVPKPKKSEKENDYISRCMSFLVGTEGKDQKQASAICYTEWRNRNKVEREEFVRSSISKGIAGKVDREFKHDKGIGAVFGYAVISKMKLSENEDIRNWEMDDKSLDQVVELGNSLDIGLKSRFGHPNMSSNALGTFLGRVKNFKSDNDIVRADLFFDQSSYSTPNGDLASYVLDLAENDPDAFGSSLVFSHELEYRLNQDGTCQKDEHGKDLPALVRFKSLRGSDIVDEPAANKGLFSFYNESVELSAKATQFFDNLLEQPDAVDRIISFLNRYSENQKEVGMPESTNQIKLDGSVITSLLKENNKELLDTLKSLGFTSPDETKLMKAQFDDLSVKIVSLEKKSQDAEFAKRIFEIKDELNSFEAIGDLQQTASIIAELEKVNPELSKSMIEQERKNAEMFAAMGFTSEHGSSSITTSALNQSMNAMKTKQAELMSKNPNMLPAQAWKHVVKENPTLYAEYVKSQPKRPLVGGLE